MVAEGKGAGHFSSIRNFRRKFRARDASPGVTHFKALPVKTGEAVGCLGEGHRE